MNRTYNTSSNISGRGGTQVWVGGGVAESYDRERRDKSAGVSAKFCNKTDPYRSGDTAAFHVQVLDQSLQANDSIREKTTQEDRHQ